MMSYILSFLFLIPLCFVSSSFWWVSSILFILSFIFLFGFGSNLTLSGISFFFGFDLLSYMMVLLSVWISGLMILASSKIFKIKNFDCLFLVTVLVLLISLVCCFCSLNLFIFYLFFEVSLIPTLFLILGWGYQPERVQASVYLLFYTLLASLPMLVALFFFYTKFGSLNFVFFKEDINSFLVFICINMVFFVKIPMYFVHLWLPKAHVEAPVAGSMILAGIMLKLGGYGMLRLFSVFMKVGQGVSSIFVSISLLGGVIVSLICLRQMDMKSLIAYSSVAHMGLAMGGIFTLNYWGLCGAFAMMIAHGLCSSGLFCLANFSYERVSSRSLYLNKGLMGFMPSMSLWWFLLCSSNMAAPPSLNLLGEIMLINSLLSWSWLSMIGISLVSFFSAAYSLYLFSFSQHGKFYSGFYSFDLGQVREYLLMILHWLPLNILVLKGEYFSLFL
uniref:NADH-ubiquinone oxidoreductase chain 4 n=1 Tax=Chrysochroa fulgidissima TaxID=543396 RepID=C5H685_9COLE|nr:NADH dehydrogenase subunit 4 [Chrysochroa fulgidissima]ACF04027.1 NADH dehydrogenase subunit 4 [Chrysochroa fulgidissima]